MTFNNMKIQINMAARAGTYDDSLGLANVNKTIVCCLLYALISFMVSNDKTYAGQVRSIAAQYLDTYIGIVESMRTKYVSYSAMRTYLRNLKYPEFTTMSKDQVQKIIDLYYNKTEIKPYSKNEFSHRMYNLADISQQGYDRLRKIHYYVMVPIFQYYIENAGAQPSDIEIYSVDNVDTNPGKEIIFRIADISPARIIVDIRDTIGVSDYIYSEEQYYDDYVKIIVK